jgi:ribonuclease HII
MSLLRYDKRAVCGHAGLVGVDEAGRGALAGPVVAAAVWLEASFYEDARRCRQGRGINDSKQLSPEARGECFGVIEQWRADGLARVTVASASVEEIALHNILGATRIAMDRCLRELHEGNGGLPTVDDGNMPLFAVAEDPPAAPARPRVLIDGRNLRPFFWRHEGLVDGDAKCFAIAAASIVAKVTRDRKMAELDGEIPGYGLAKHKGYGTPEHWEALRRLGPSAHHRALFLRKMNEESSPATEQSEWEFSESA